MKNKSIVYIILALVIVLVVLTGCDDQFSNTINFYLDRKVESLKVIDLFCIALLGTILGNQITN